MHDTGLYRDSGFRSRSHSEWKLLRSGSSGLLGYDVSTRYGCGWLTGYSETGNFRFADNSEVTGHKRLRPHDRRPTCLFLAQGDNGVKAGGALGGQKAGGGGGGGENDG